MTTADTGFEPKPNDATGYTRMNAAFASIRKKLKEEGASISIHALLLWALDDAACKAYFGPYPWLLKKLIGLAVEQYCSDNLDESFSFIQAKPPKLEL